MQHVFEANMIFSTLLRRAWYCYGRLSVHPSVCS